MTAVEMLSFWEVGSRLSPLDRGVQAAQLAGVPAAQAADLPLGERNRLLAQVYCRHFGNSLDGFTECTACGEKLEFHFDLTQISDAPALVPPELVTVGRWKFQLPTSRAIATALNGGDEARIGQRLLTCCLRESEVAEPAWTEEEIEAIESRLAEADQLAEILIDFECPRCESSFEDALDLESFLWTEIQESARQIFDDIHILASAYGWTEPEVLNLSPQRRSAYVRRVTG